MSDTDDGMLPFPLNYIFVLFVCLGFFMILWTGLGIEEDLAAIWQMITGAIQP